MPFKTANTLKTGQKVLSKSSIFPKNNSSQVSKTSLDELLKQLNKTSSSPNPFSSGNPSSGNPSSGNPSSGNIKLNVAEGSNPSQVTKTTLDDVRKSMPQKTSIFPTNDYSKPPFRTGYSGPSAAPTPAPTKNIGNVPLDVAPGFSLSSVEQVNLEDVTPSNQQQENPITEDDPNTDFSSPPWSPDYDGPSSETTSSSGGDTHWASQWATEDDYLKSRKKGSTDKWDQFTSFMKELSGLQGMFGGGGYPSMGYGGYNPGGVAAANPYKNMMNFMNAFKNMNSYQESAPTQKSILLNQS